MNGWGRPGITSRPKSPKLYSALSLGCSMRLRNRESAYPIEDWDDREIAVYGPHDFVEQDLLFGPPSCFILVSQRLRGLVEKSFPGEVNFYGVRLQRVDGSGERGGYSLGQVLQKADCIDTDRTEGHGANRMASRRSGRFMPLRPSVPAFQLPTTSSGPWASRR